MYSSIFSFSNVSPKSIKQHKQLNN